MHNEDLGNVAEETVINLRVCPVCNLEIFNKPMTPSNYVQNNNSFMSNPVSPREQNLRSPTAAEQENTPSKRVKIDRQQQSNIEVNTAEANDKVRNEVKSQTLMEAFPSTNKDLNAVKFD